MDQPIPNQQPAYQNPLPGTPIEQAPILQAQKHVFDPRYIFLLLIFIGIGGGLFMFTAKTPSVVPTPTLIETPTPTPKAKALSPVATLSGYLDLSKSIASLSAKINAMQVSDTTLSPPTIELPLGFQSE